MLDLRVGSGLDVHRFIRGRPLVLGGVLIPHEFGLDGHSDADVLVHALMDALLGGAGFGDIGVYFPPSDEKYRGADSVVLLSEVMLTLRKSGWSVINADCTVVTEAPRLRPYIDTMRAVLAPVLGLASDCVNIKAGTNEKLGFIGRAEGIAAMATVLLKR